MKKKIILLIAGLFILIIAIILTIYFYSIYPKYFPSFLYFGITPANLKFSTERCDSSQSYKNSGGHGIINQEWKDNQTLVVNGYVQTYCGGVKFLGDYSIDGNNLILEYKRLVGNIITECVCPYKLIYEISNLEKKDYSVSLVGK